MDTADLITGLGSGVGFRSPLRPRAQQKVDEERIAHASALAERTSGQLHALTSELFSRLEAVERRQARLALEPC